MSARRASLRRSGRLAWGLRFEEDKRNGVPFEKLLIRGGNSFNLKSSKTTVWRCLLISEETIKKIADLARLSLSQEEVALYSKQLGAVLDYVSKLSEIDTAGVAPLVTATDMAPTKREDIVEPYGESGWATANAPEKSGNLYKVPPVL
jgi:aspartyl-tRNA(Asn)/glutamyl-tRNA(Gln) amidotransferase subunit C